MAKLYGTADPTLVSAAFHHGRSMMPGDMKDIYALKAANVKAFGEGISKMFDEIYADNKNTMDLLNDNATKALDIMEAGGMPNDWGIEMHSGVVNDYKSRLKAIPQGKKGDLERSKLRAEMNRYLSNIESGENMFVDMVSNAANSRLLNDLGDDKAKLFNLMVEDHNNGTSMTKSSYENGEIVYSVPGSDIKLSMREINEGMSAHDPKYLSGIQQKLTSFQAKGKAMGGQMTADDALRFKNELQTSITSWDEIRNVSQEKFGNMKFTFEQVLTGQAKDPITGVIDTDLTSNIYDELEALGGIDIDNDGDIDETDKSLLAQARKNGEIYTDAKNGFTLIDALKKDKQKYRDVMANYLTETAVKDFYGQGAAQFKGKKSSPVNPHATDDDKITYDLPSTIRIGELIDGRYQVEMDDWKAESILKDVESGTTFPFQSKIYSYVFDESGAGNWHGWGKDNVEQNPTEESFLGSAADLETYVFNTKHPTFKGMVTKKTEGGAVDREGVIIDPQTAIIDEMYTMMNVGNDDDAAENLNKKFGLSKKEKSKIMFAPYEGKPSMGSYGTGLFDADDTGTDSVMMYNPQTGEAIRDANGDVIEIPSGEDLSTDELNASIKNILKLLEEKKIDTGVTSSSSGGADDI